MSITVFLADDHAVVRDGLRTLLDTQDDIQVVGDASNGRDAVRQVEQLNPDVVILDISMPELNGIDAARQMVQLCPSARIVMLSMHSTTEHVFRALQAGAHGYLLKESAGIEVVTGVTGTVRDAVVRYKSGELHASGQATVDSHFGMKGGA